MKQTKTKKVNLKLYAVTDMQTKNQTRKLKTTASPMLGPSILFKEKESKRRGRGAKRNKLTRLGAGCT